MPWPIADKLVSGRGVEELQGGSARPMVALQCSNQEGHWGAFATVPTQSLGPGQPSFSTTAHERHVRLD